MAYDNLVDPSIWAYIEELNLSAVSGSGTQNIAQERETYGRLAEIFQMPRSENVQVSDQKIDHVAVRVYSIGAPTRTILFCHGGGFVLGNLDTHDDICAELCEKTGFRVVAVDYRLAPEHQHPAQFDDAWKVACWVSETYPGGMVLVGDSAGGALCACIAHRARGVLPEILGQVLIYPVLGDDTMGQESYRQHAQAPLLSVEDMLYYNKVRSTAGMPVGDATYLPLYDTDFKDLPPTVLFSADVDPLRDDCELYQDQLHKTGVKVHWVNEPGLVHSYLRARHIAPLAGQSFERIALAIEMLGEEHWAWDSQKSDPNQMF